MRKAVFLDRDGVITKEFGFICPIEQVEVFPYVADCVKMIHDAGYYAIVISNQSGVARGLFTEEELMRLNNRIQTETGVDAIYYCPHHIDGKIEKYRVVCDCRKPQIGMILRASEDFDVCMDGSYMVGDRAADILCGQNAGLTTVLLNSGYGEEKLEQEVTADYIMSDLREFSKWLK